VRKIRVRYEHPMSRFAPPRIARLVPVPSAGTLVVTAFWLALSAGACATPVKPAVLSPVAPPSAPTKAEVCEDKDPYRPRVASQAPQPDLPPIPEVPKVALKIGEDYTVTGAVRTLHARFHESDFSNDVTIVGVIVASNLATAPACALHSVGQKDPEHCEAEIPSFTLADDAKSTARIRVLGWASNFASVFEALKLGTSSPAARKPYTDERWSVVVPYPLPAVGAKVRVHGHYGTLFEKSSGGLIADPDNGIFTSRSIDVLVPASTPAKLGR
jgi:hypothetical protein